MSAQNINGDLVWMLPNGTYWTAGGVQDTNCTVSVCPVELSVYGYRPSLAASGTLIALYALCAVIQLILGLRYRTWWFMVAMILGCIVEIIGYVGRILYWQNPWSKAGFLIQIILITIGPVFFAAAIYVLLIQIINYVSTNSSRFTPKIYAWTFIPLDVLCLILQAIGGAMSSTSNGASNTGINIALAGLILQVITLLGFIVLVIDYFIRSRRVWRQGHLSRQFKIFCLALTLATIFIFIRCVYRVYELNEGYSRDSEALRDEPLFIGLESVMVILTAWCLIIAHPGFLSKTSPIGLGTTTMTNFDEESKSNP